jgi:hypothetical protein
MNTHSTVLENASAEATTSGRILQTALAAWKQDNFIEVADQLMTSSHPATMGSDSNLRTRDA